MAKGERRGFRRNTNWKVLRQADNCKQSGELGTPLRREGLYWSNLTPRRKQLAAHDASELGRAPASQRKKRSSALSAIYRDTDQQTPKKSLETEGAEGVNFSMTAIEQKGGFHNAL